MLLMSIKSDQLMVYDNKLVLGPYVLFLIVENLFIIIMIYFIVLYFIHINLNFLIARFSGEFLYHQYMQ